MASGGLIGTALGRILGNAHAKAPGEQLAAGGLPLWVTSRAPADEARALAVLLRHAATDVHIHSFPANS